MSDELLPLVIREEFRVHILNEQGIAAAKRLGEMFTEFLNNVEACVGTTGRHVALVRTHLETASFFAKKALAGNPELQLAPPKDDTSIEPW